MILLTDSLKALADAYRQNILKLLAHQEMGVCEIINSIGLSQPAVSHHLKILKHADLVKSVKKGKIVFYSLNKEGVIILFNQVTGFINDLSCFTDCEPAPSPLRENPNLCMTLGYKSSVCEEI